MSASSYQTLMDIARRSGNADSSRIIEVLNKTNEALDDIPFVMCNNGTVHKTTLRTSLPTPYWTRLNKGVGLVKANTEQIQVGCGMLEAYSEVDTRQVDFAAVGLNGEAANAAVSHAIAGENEAVIEGFGQEVSRVMFYGGSDPKKPEEPIGFTHWYKKLSDKNVISGPTAGATANKQTSIWLIAWGPQTIHGIYPQGSVGGFREHFLNEHTVTDKDGGQFQAYRTHYKWDVGFCVRDVECGVRICNIDMTKLIANDSGKADLIDLMISAVYKLPKRASGCRMAFYCGKEVMTALDKQTRNAVSSQLNYDTVYGRKCLTFRGIPVRQQDSISTTEPVIS